MTEEETVQITTADQKPKLDKMVLLRFIIGIVAYNVLMIFFINNLIFHNIAEPRAAYYISISISNLLFFALILIIKTDKSLSWGDMGLKQVKIAAGLKDMLKTWFLAWLVSLFYMFFVIDSGITVPENKLLIILQNPSLIMLILNIILIAVVAPFVEETLFRGLLLGSLRTYCGPWTAIVISAAIFSALHLELLGFVPRLILGIALGYLYVKHNSILPSIALHAFNNLLAVLVITFLA